MSYQRNLTAEVVDGKEKILTNISFLPNITHLYFYPSFGDKTFVYSFTFSLFLKNISLASEPAQYSISICKENCSCTHIFLNLFFYFLTIKIFKLLLIYIIVNA